MGTAELRRAPRADPSPNSMAARAAAKRTPAEALCAVRIGAITPLGGTPAETAETVLETIFHLSLLIENAEEMAAEFPHAENYASMTPSIKAGALEAISTLASVATFLLRNEASA